MSQQFHRASTGDTVTVPDVLAPNYQARNGWAPGPLPATAEAADGDAPKGQALDDALELAGLSKAGTADEKRARLAEHEENS